MPSTLSKIPIRLYNALYDQFPACLPGIVLSRFCSRHTDLHIPQRGQPDFFLGPCSSCDFYLKYSHYMFTCLALCYYPSFIPGLPRWYSGKESAGQSRRCKRHGFDPWVRKIPWSRKWQPTLVVLSKKFHRQRSLGDYSPWGCKELDTTMTEHTHVSSPITIIEMVSDHLKESL